jgi:hypothetical protein
MYAEELLSSGDLSMFGGSGSSSHQKGLSGAFDAVVSVEVIEHVAAPPAFVSTLHRLIAPDGALVLATLNRTLASRALAIVAAEYILQWVCSIPSFCLRLLFVIPMHGVCSGAGWNTRLVKVSDPRRTQTNGRKRPHHQRSSCRSGLRRCG